MQRLKMLNITIPAVTAKSLNRKQVECSRNVSKLLIRGEQIATIILDTDTDTNRNRHKQTHTQTDIDNETGTGNKKHI